MFFRPFGTLYPQKFDTPSLDRFGVFFHMPLPEKYHQAADDANVRACIAAIRPLYEHFNPVDIAEAHFQIRKELDMIKETEEKKKRIRALKADLEDQDIAE